MSFSAISRIPLAIRTNQDSSSPSSSSTYDSAQSHLSFHTIDLKSLYAPPATRIPRLKSSPEKPCTIAPLHPIRLPESGRSSGPHELPLNTITERLSVAAVNKPLPMLPFKPLPALPTENLVTKHLWDFSSELDETALHQAPQPYQAIDQCEAPIQVLGTKMDPKTLDLCREIDSIWSATASTTRQTMVCPSPTA